MSESIESVIEPAAEGVVIKVRAQPGARRNGVTGVREGELCVAVTAPPDRGRANDAIVKVLATALGVPRSRIGLISGPTNRHKRFAVLGVEADQASATLSAAAPPRD